MRPLFRSILLARPSAACSVSSTIRQLHLSPRLACLGCQRPQQQQQRQQQLKLGQIRWVASGPGNTEGTGGSSSGDRPPPPLPPPLPPPSSPPPISGPNFKNLPSQKEFRRSEMAKKVSGAMEDLQVAVFTAGQKLNVLTGYSEIESLKKQIENLEATVKSSRTAVRTAKEDYQAAIARRSASQREVNELLQRKHAWSPSDLERFTSLYRSDHANEQAEAAAQEQLAVAERVADDVQAKLSRSILSRYHEEQIWSDKIRRASTWVTWGLMGFNVLLFVVVQLWLEPWKRRRLVGGFEQKVKEVIQEEGRRNALLNMGMGPATVIVPAMKKEEEEEEEEVAEDIPVQDVPEVGTAAVVDSEPVLLEDDILHTPAGEHGMLVSSGSLATVEVPSEERQTKWYTRGGLGLLRKWLAYAGGQVDDAFSEQVIYIKKYEFATALLGSMGLGAFLAALVSLMWNSL